MTSQNAKTTKQLVKPNLPLIYLTEFLSEIEKGVFVLAGPVQKIVSKNKIGVVLEEQEILFANLIKEPAIKIFVDGKIGWVTKRYYSEI
jgi:hypothetical protein